jgi:hypothetical protein
MRVTRIKIGRTNKETHRIQAVENLYRKYWTKSKAVGRVIDPFARNCPWAGEYTNDIAIDSDANYNMDALDFLKRMEIEKKTFVLGILDPPFSPRQANEAYGGDGANLYASDSPRLRRIERQLGRIIVPGGYILKFGYNSNPPVQDWDLVEIKLLCFGGVVNDWILSVWKNRNTRLEDFE